MRSKSFFYTCAGIFLLVAAYTMGARHALADWDTSVTGDIVGGAFEAGFIYDRTGAAWTVYSNPPGWVRANDVPSRDLPFPVSDLKFLEGGGGQAAMIAITKSDVAWGWDMNRGWFEIGPFPGTTIPVEGKTWSGVKEGYRKK
jgi:hypothetical protein